MDEKFLDLPSAEESHPSEQAHQPISGTYTGQRGSYRLELRLDLGQQSPHDLYQPLDLVSGDFFRDVGGGEWDYRSSFIVEHPHVTWGAEEVTAVGTMAYYRNMELVRSAYEAVLIQALKVTIPLCAIHEPAPPATAQVIHWGNYETTFLCNKTSALLRTIDLEIDRIASTELPRSFNTQSVAEHPADLPAVDLDIPRSYQWAGIDMRVIPGEEVFAPAEAGADLKWDQDELHHAMEQHFSQWRDEPQWKLYLLIATHFKLYPDHLVTGIMYDNQYRDANDPSPRQGAAAFYSTMREVWGSLPQAEFDRNYLRTCVHELGHALNLLHPFDKDRPDSLSWMNYPWRYPYGYNLPSGWDGTRDYWRNCRFEFDAEELRHLRHHALTEVIPGGAPFGSLGHEIPVPLAVPARQLEAAPAQSATCSTLPSR